MSALSKLASRLSERWNQLWFAPASPHPIAAFRILLGAYLLGYLGILAPHTTLLFSSDGVYVPYLVPDYGPPPLAAGLMFALFYALCILLTLGVATLWTIPLLIAVYLYHYFLSLGVKHSSFERLVVIYLLALWAGRADAVWSISAWLRERRAGDSSQTEIATASVFTSRLVRFQTIVLYLGAGLWKAANPAWHNGALLLSTVRGVWATPLAFWIARRGFSEQLWTYASWSVIAAELSIATCLFFRPTRPIGIVLGITFHLSNCVILAIPEFIVCMTPYVFFLRESTVERVGSRIAHLLSSARFHNTQSRKRAP